MNFWLLIATQVLIALAILSIARDYVGIQHQIRLLRKEVEKMAITQDDVKALAEAVGRLVDITAAAIAAAAGDREAKDVAVAELQTLRGEVAWLNDPELDQKIDDMIAAAAAATPAE